MKSFEFHLRTRGMFVYRMFWEELVPPFDPEFIEWMDDMFGPKDERWSYVMCYHNVRMRGKIGGWGLSPYKIVFNFEHDDDAVVFMLKWRGELCPA